MVGEQEGRQPKTMARAKAEQLGTEESRPKAARAGTEVVMTARVEHGRPPTTMTRKAEKTGMTTRFVLGHSPWLYLSYDSTIVYWAGYSAQSVQYGLTHVVLSHGRSMGTDVEMLAITGRSSQAGSPGPWPAPK